MRPAGAIGHQREYVLGRIPTDESKWRIRKTDSESPRTRDNATTIAYRARYIGLKPNPASFRDSRENGNHGAV